MHIQTNRLKIRFDIGAIERDFAFIRFFRERRMGWYGAAQLDHLLGSEYNADAVMFQYSQYAYAMFRKPVDTHQIISRIRRDEEFNEDTIIEVLPRASRNDAEHCICEAWLAQILLNSLSSSRSRFTKYHFCNLTGSLILIPDLIGKKRDCIDAAKISITHDYLLEAEIVRHRSRISILSEMKKAHSRRKRTLQKTLEGPQYIFHSSTKSLRRHLPRDGKMDSKTTYAPCGFEGKRASVPFLQFGSMDDFLKCRAGILDHVITNVQTHFSDYMNIDLLSQKVDHSLDLSNTLLKRPTQLHSKFDGQPVRIVDRVDNEESADLVADLKESLLPYLPDKTLITCGKREKKDALNFRIIHDAAYYEEAGQKDEYLGSTDAIQRQHLTIESTGAVSSAMVKTIVKEQLIKQDIANRKLNLFNWCQLDPKQTWTFASYADNNESESVVFMDIKPDGHFDFQEFDDTQMSTPPEYQNYMEVMAQMKRKTRNAGLNLEGLVALENGNVNLLLRTKEISLPDLPQIKSIINDVGSGLPEGKRRGSDLSDLVKEFMADSTKQDNNVLVMFTDTLTTLGNNELNKNTFRKLLNEQLGKNTKIASEFRHYLLNKHHIRLSFPKKKESLNNLFNASLNIKYFGETEDEAFYLVGDRRENVQFSFTNACHLRKIVAAKGSKLVFKEILQTMDVDFVRTGQSTVLPFPFKYIREYIKFTKNHA